MAAKVTMASGSQSMGSGGGSLPVTTRTGASAHLYSGWVYLCNTRTWRRQCTSCYQWLWKQPGRAASLLRSPCGCTEENLPRDRAKMNIFNTCQLSSSPDPHPIPPPESAGSDSVGLTACDLVSFSPPLHIPVDGQRYEFSKMEILHFIFFSEGFK